MSAIGPVNAQSKRPQSLAAPTVGKSREQAESSPDLKVNHCFNLGNRDGVADHKQSPHSIHESECATDGASDAYRIGYNQGFIGERSYRRDHRLSSWARSRVRY